MVGRQKGFKAGREVWEAWREVWEARRDDWEAGNKSWKQEGRFGGWEAGREE